MSSSRRWCVYKQSSGTRIHHHRSAPKKEKKKNGRLSQSSAPAPPPPHPPPVARLRLRPLRAPLQSLLLHLLAHPRRRFLRLRHGRRVLQRRTARVGGAGPVQKGRRLRRVLPGAVQGRGALRHRRREGRRHGPRQDKGQQHRPRAEQPGVRRHGPPWHGPAAHQARRRRCRVQEGAVRVPGQEPLGAGGAEEPRAERPRRHVPLPGRPDRHGRRRRRAGRDVELEVHDAGPRAGVEHGPGAGGAAAAPGGGDRRVRREVAVGRPGGPAAAVARRRGVRHRAADHRHRPGGLLPLRHAGVEVTAGEASQQAASHTDVLRAKRPTNGARRLVAVGFGWAWNQRSEAPRHRYAMPISVGLGIGTVEISN